MADWNPRANELFLKAVDLPAADRPAFLGRECGSDASLRAAVDTLLVAHGRANKFLAGPNPAAVQTGDFPGDITRTAGDAARGRLFPMEAAGQVVAGRYKLLQQIGEGGMGTVWMADQTEPVKRRVAVKVIRADMGSSKTILSRFEAERQAIAVMDHPHIAKLLDAGTTEAGSPFFVMELVKGVPLTDFCDAQKLSIPERLGLFVQICSAVQHAHQKGIIHRDLKPTNILVENHDGKPVPKVIDFGLAKATTGLQLSEHTLFTAFGSVMGTPLYMAPEQANFNAVDVDTRADIYALGVILYELLTGTTPLTREAIKKALLDEMLMLIREQEAPTPSSRLSSADSQPSVAANRQMEPAKLGRFVKGELDWIVLKALSKERDRRYETANGFAKDIERFLHHEPVTAGPVGAGYKLRKFVQRNRGQVVAAAAVFFAVFAGAAAATWQAVRADGERRRAEANEQQARAAETRANEQLAATEAARRAETEQRKRADEQAAIATAVNDFLQKDLLNQANPDELSERTADFDPNMKVRTALDLAAATVGHTFRDRPIVEAAIRQTLGNAYRSLGEYARSIEHLERAYHQRRDLLGPDHRETLSAMLDLVTSYQYSERTDDAIALARTAWDIQQTRHGKAHPDALKALKQLTTSHLYQNDSQVAAAIPFFEQVAAEVSATHGPDDDATLAVLAEIPVLHRRAGNRRKGIELLERIHSTRVRVNGPEAPETLASLEALAFAYCSGSGERREEGLKLYRQIHAIHLRIHGPEDDRTLRVLHAMGLWLAFTDQSDEAVTIYQTILDVRRRTIGLQHPKSWGHQHQLGMSLIKADRAGESVPVFEHLCDIKAKQYGAAHPDVMYTNGSLAYALRIAGRPEEAIRLLEPILVNITRNPDAAYRELDSIQYHLAQAYSDAGRHPEAIAQIEEMFARLLARKTLSANDFSSIKALLPLRIYQFRIKKDPLACRATAEMWEKYQSARNSDDLFNAACHWAITAAVQAKAPGADAARIARDDADKAMTWLHKAVQAGRSDTNEFQDDPDLDALRERDDYKKLVADMEAKAGKRPMTMQILEANLKFTKAKQGPGHPNTLVCMYNLANGYWATGKLDLALPLYEKTLPLMRARLGTDHSHTLRCMSDIAVAFWSLKRLERSVPQFEEALPLFENRYGRDHAFTQMIAANLGVNYKEVGRLKEAIPLLEEAHRASMKLPALSFVAAPLFEAYTKSGKSVEAAKLIDEARRALPKDSPQLSQQLAQFGLALMDAKRFAEAEPLLRECLSIREKTQPDAWNTFNVKSMLGGALLAQKKHADAEPLLLAGYEGMKAREKTIPAAGGGSLRIPEALDRLIDLYTATNKPDEVKKWQTVRAMYLEIAPPPRVKK